jgi:cell wall assembly regulator SMI1
VTDGTATVPAAIDRIDGWLRERAVRAHDAVSPAADEADLRAAEVTVGRPLPADLRLWWSYADGMDELRDGGSLIPPGFMPLSVRGALRNRVMLEEITRDTWPSSASELESYVSEQVREPAGTPGQHWLPAWLPVAHDRGGTDMFVDLRAGSLHGCVTVFRMEFGTEPEPMWPSVAVMLGDIADRLERGEAEVDDRGRLYWPWERMVPGSPGS